MTQWYKSDGFLSFPLPPDEAAETIVEMLLSDLPPDRQAAVRDAIELWAREREDAVIHTVMECG